MRIAIASCTLAAALAASAAAGCAEEPGPADGGQAAPVAAASAFGIRPYLRSPGRTGMTVAWTAPAAAEFTIKYGEGRELDAELSVQPLPEPIEYSPKPPAASGSKTTATDPPSDEPEVPAAKLKQWQYLARLEGLNPGTVYGYEVVAPSGEKAAGSFETFPERSDSFTFVACADSQDPDGLRRAGRAAMQWKPKFIVHAGDMLDHGWFFEEWAPCFFEPLAGVVDRVPLLPARGNHDGREFVDRLFAFPEGRFYYSFDYGNVHFTVLRSRPYEPTDEAALKWCDEDLAASRADWKVVYFHHPSYDTGTNEADCWGRNDFVPVFRKRGVDLVMSGHTHVYERFRPMFAKGENEKRPITFMVIGGAGGGTMRVSQDPTLAVGKSTDHYLVVNVKGRRLSVRAMDLDGAEVDAFEIGKDADGNLDPGYLAAAVPEELFGRLRGEIAPQVSALSLPESPRTGKPVKVAFPLAAGASTMKYRLGLEPRSAGSYELKPASGEIAAGGSAEVEAEVVLKHAGDYARRDPIKGFAPTPALRLELFAEVEGQKASVFSNPVAYQPFAYGPYLTAPGRTEMTVRWASAEDREWVVRWGAGDKLDREMRVKPSEPIEWKPRPKNKPPAAAPNATGAPAADAAPAAEEKVYREQLYVARLEGLEPGTRYRYAVGLPSGEERGGSFATFPAPGGAEGFTFAAIGDTQAPEGNRLVANALRKWQPRFVLHVGDLTDEGSIYPNWAAHLFGPYGAVLAGSPLMPARGNHDTGGMLPRIFSLPENRLYYSYDYGDAHFICLDGYGRPEMLEWLEKDLAASKARWKIAYSHFPSYDVGPHGNAAGRATFLPLYRKYGVDLAFAGHSHVYERFLPMYTKGENEKHPITFMVVGGGGGNLMRVAQDPYLAVGASTHHYVAVTVTADSLRARAILPNGKELDSFEIKKAADGSLDAGYLAKAVPEEDFGRLRAAVAPSMRGLALSDDPRTGKATVKLTMGAGEQAARFTVRLESRAANDYEMPPAVGECPAGGTTPVEVSIRLKDPTKFADPKKELPILRLEGVFEIGGRTVSVFGNRLVFKAADQEPPAKNEGDRDKED